MFQREEHFAATGVRVNCLCPWFVQTELSELTKEKDIYFPTKYPEVFEELLTEYGFIQ